MAATTQLTPVGGGRRYAFTAKSGEHPVGILTQATAVGGGRRYGSFAGRAFSGAWPIEPSGALNSKGAVTSTTNGISTTSPAGEHPVGILTQNTPVGGGRSYGDFNKSTVETALDAVVELFTKGRPTLSGGVAFGIAKPLGAAVLRAKGAAGLAGQPLYLAPGMHPLGAVQLGPVARVAVSGGLAYRALLNGDVEAIANAVWSKVLESGLTAEQIQRVILSVLAGKVSGANTGIERFRNVADTKDRVAVTVDDDGNRSFVTLDVT